MPAGSVGIIGSLMKTVALTMQPCSLPVPVSVHVRLPAPVHATALTAATSPGWRLQRIRLVIHALAFSLGAALLPSAQAQMFKDPGLQALLQQERNADLQRAARERLLAQPDDSQAVLALALGVLNAGDAALRQAAIVQAEACALKQPQAAACHYALGVVLGAQALSEGMLKAARSAGTVRSALVQAHALEPGWYPARSALLEFHLLAPSLMGGNTARAEELARSAPNQAQARVLHARIDVQAGRDEAALHALSDLLGSTDKAVADDAAEWGFGVSARLINDGKATAAQTFLERLAQERPASAQGPYGLGRLRALAGAPAEALKLYDQAAARKGAGTLPIEYRRGLALQELGRKDEARAALGRFVGTGKGSKVALDDARKRLTELGG